MPKVYEFNNEVFDDENEYIDYVRRSGYQASSELKGLIFSNHGKPWTPNERVLAKYQKQLIS